MPVFAGKLTRCVLGGGASLMDRSTLDVASGTTSVEEASSEWIRWAASHNVVPKGE
jgi:hypothetical protein